jgi:hypothetical protein
VTLILEYCTLWFFSSLEQLGHVEQALEEADQLIKEQSSSTLFPSLQARQVTNCILEYFDCPQRDSHTVH